MPCFFGWQPDVSHVEVEEVITLEGRTDETVEVLEIAELHQLFFETTDVGDVIINAVYEL